MSARCLLSRINSPLSRSCPARKSGAALPPRSAIF
jgi:hypothetical protein